MRVRKKPRCQFYYCEFWLGGKRYSLSTRTTKKPLALQIGRALYEKELKRLHGIPVDENPSLEELLRRYETWLRGERTGRTRVRALRAIRNVIDRLCVKYPSDITREGLADYRARRRGEASICTCSLELRSLKAFLRRAVREKWIPALPCEIEVPSVPTKGRIVFLTRDEIDALLGHLKPWARWAAFLMVNTGVRAEEASFLEWSDVDFDSGLLWVVNKPHLDFHPKNTKERSVPLSPALMAELVARRKNAGWVLEGPNGGQVKRMSLLREITAAGKRAGLKKHVTPHVLRHSFGSAMAMAGVPLPTIQDIMGHSKIATTMVYVHLSEDHRREAVAKLKLPGMRPEPEKIIAMPGTGRHKTKERR